MTIIKVCYLLTSGSLLLTY